MVKRYKIPTNYNPAFQYLGEFVQKTLKQKHVDSGEICCLMLNVKNIKKQNKENFKEELKRCKQF